MIFDDIARLARNLFAPPNAGEEIELPKTLPVHVAFIMDGNGRWAKSKGMPRTAGHAAGTEALRDIIRAFDEWGIPCMSIYAFSTENWSRSPEEVTALMNLVVQYFTSEIDELNEKRVCIRILGDLDAFEKPQRDALLRAQDVTKNNDGLKLNIALNYGGRAEITMAARKLALKAARGEIKPGEITPDTVSQALYTHDLPDVDLLIRTGGDKRLSNFLPWQTWYSEIIFSPVYWPDYNRAYLKRDLAEFASRDRRYGKVK